MAGFIIAAELAERRLVQVKQNLAQLLGCRITGGKTLSVYLTQFADERGSVLVADFAIVVEMAIVETCLTHAALHCTDIETSSHWGQMATLCRNRELSRAYRISLS